MLFDTLLEEGILPKTQEGMPSKEKEDVTNKGEEGVATEKGAMLNESKNEVKGCNTDEILAVLAHELGHWKLSHNLKNIVIAEVGRATYLTVINRVIWPKLYICSVHIHVTLRQSYTNTCTQTGKSSCDFVHVQLLHEPARPLHQLWVS